MPQAKDVPLIPLLETVEAFRHVSGKGQMYLGAFTSALQEHFEAFPPKVVLARLRALERRGILSGCPCGCRGDWELTAKGRELLDRKVMP